VQPSRSQTADRLWNLTASLFGLRGLLGLIDAIFNIDAAWFRYGLAMPFAIAWLTALSAFLVVRGREIIQFRRTQDSPANGTPAAPN
jgi:hypothetical protein